MVIKTSILRKSREILVIKSRLPDDQDFNFKKIKKIPIIKPRLQFQENQERFQ